MSKKIRNIIIVLIILLMILISLLIFSQSKKNKINRVKEKLEYIKNDDWNDEIYPDGMPKLFRMYKGKLSAQNMGKSIYYFTTDIIPKYYSKLKNATSDEISSYYISNSKIIAMDTGIKDEQDFQELIENIQELDLNELILDSFRIDKDRIEVSNEYTDIILYITYKESKEIEFNVRIYNAFEENTSSLIYTSLENE